MESKVNYTLTGLFIVIFASALVIIAFLLSKGFSEVKYKSYTVYMNESVIGLHLNAPVKYNGVDVGIVGAIDLNHNNPKQVKLTLDIKEDLPIREDARAILTSQGLTGISFVNLTGGSVTSPLLKEKNDEAYPVILAEPSLLFRVDSALRELSISLTGLSEDMRAVLDSDNRRSFKNSLQNVERLTSVLAENAAQLDKTMKQMPLALASIQKAGADISSTMQSGRTAIQTLNQLTTPLNELASDLHRNPALLIRGREPGMPGPGER
jgi:phospholipid/cholesterol/gamma-HCH transport system substrate-binding protein